MRLLPISILIFPMPYWPKRQEFFTRIRRKLIFLPLKMAQEVSNSLIYVWKAHKEEPVGYQQDDLTSKAGTLFFDTK
jgi:hypothetical protein